MKKTFIFGFVFGLAIGLLGISTVIAASGVSSATFNSNKVFYNGTEIDLTDQPMISVVKNEETISSNYMPLRRVLERMGHTVTWDEGTNSILISDTWRDTPLEDRVIYAPNGESARVKDLLPLDNPNGHRRNMDVYNEMLQTSDAGAVLAVLEQAHIPPLDWMILGIDEYQTWTQGGKTLFGDLLGQIIITPEY
jgi:hypothetical protein